MPEKNITKKNITEKNITEKLFDKYYDEIYNKTPALLKLRAKNNKLVKYQRLSPSPTNKERSRIFRNYYNSEIRKGKLKYYKDLFAESGSDSKVIWGIINQLMNRPQISLVSIH